MPRSGEPYQELVGAVASALDPDATVTVGNWVEGPDGRRDMDVAIRGTAQGESKFVLIECKDWTRPVGIATVDALESKRRDLGASSAMIYSNSGFTQPALRKAVRVGIETASALAIGDDRVRVKLYREFVAKRKAVRHAAWIVWPLDDENDRLIPSGYDLFSVFYDGLPVANWLHHVSSELLPDCETDCTIRGKYAFKGATEFSVSGATVVLRGIGFRLDCTVRFVSQTVRPDVSLGHFDHSTNRIVVPSQQFYSFGIIDNEAWEETDAGWEDASNLQEGTFALHLTMLAPVPLQEDFDSPDIAGLVSESEIKVESDSGAV